MSIEIEQKLVFFMSETKTGHVAILGIPKGAWEYMKDGKTHNLDLTRLGFPVQIMLFGDESHDACMKTIQEAAAKMGVPYLDERRKDFSIKEKP